MTTTTTTRINDTVITSSRCWDYDSVRETCIRGQFYTCGTCKDYEAMLQFVEENEPTTENLFTVAVDIWNHSDSELEGFTVENIMSRLEREAVRTWFETEIAEEALDEALAQEAEEEIEAQADDVDHMKNSYTVNSVNEAWNKANEIFPTDYIHDSDCTRRAGYDVYWSTLPGCNAWISDLGDRLEVNLPNGESINIWIEEPEFQEYMLKDALEVINEALYQIDDLVLPKLQKKIGMDAAREQLYGGFKVIAEILRKDYPDSELIARYNLNEA